MLWSSSPVASWQHRINFRSHVWHDLSNR